MTLVPANWSFKDRSLGYVHNKSVVKKAQKCTFSTFYFVQIAPVQGTPCKVGSVEAVGTVCLPHGPKTVPAENRKYIVTLSPAIFCSEVFFCQRMLEKHLVLQTYHNWRSCTVMRDTQIVSKFCCQQTHDSRELVHIRCYVFRMKDGPTGNSGLPMRAALSRKVTPGCHSSL